ncbi:MAG: hypothetical protein QM778_34855 [Myxococcales bacterium]
MERASAVRALAVSFCTLIACTHSERPSPTATCLAPSSGPDACEDQICLEEQQTLTVDSHQASDGQFNCRGCKDPDVLSRDDRLENAFVTFSTPDLEVHLTFDNRVSLDLTLENLRKYAGDASGTYHVQGGGMGFAFVPFEVASYTGGRLRVRFDASLGTFSYDGERTPYSCDVVIGGQTVPSVCTKMTCGYQTQAGGHPVELAVDLAGELAFY